MLGAGLQEFPHNKHTEISYSFLTRVLLAITFKGMEHALGHSSSSAFGHRSSSGTCVWSQVKQWDMRLSQRKQWEMRLVTGQVVGHAFGHSASSGTCVWSLFSAGTCVWTQYQERTCVWAFSIKRTCRWPFTPSKDMPFVFYPFKKHHRVFFGHFLGDHHHHQGNQAHN